LIFIDAFKEAEVVWIEDSSTHQLRGIE